MFQDNKAIPICFGVPCQWILYFSVHHAEKYKLFDLCSVYTVPTHIWYSKQEMVTWLQIKIKIVETLKIIQTFIYLQIIDPDVSTNSSSNLSG